MKKSFCKKCVAWLASILFVTASGCVPTPPNGDITVCMPDGAPALALAQLMHEDKADDGVTYRVVKSDAIATKVTYTDMQKNSDLCILPITAAAKLLGKGDRYVMLGAVTHGNLYVISKTQTSLSSDNISTLIGKKVGVLQINNVPGLTFKAMLNKYGLAWQELTNGSTMSEDKVNLIAITGADAVGTVEADCFMLAEPAASKQEQKGYSIVGDLQTLYGENGYTQAVLVAKKDLVEKKETWVKEFTKDVAEAAAWLKVATGEEIVSAVTAHLEDENMTSDLKAPMLTLDVLSRCGVRYVSAKECKDKTNGFLQALLEVAPNATSMPSAAFYWNE